MTLHRMVNGVQVDLTPSEEQAQINEWNANAAAMPAPPAAYVSARVTAITALGDYALYTATNGAGSYEAAVSTIIQNNPKPASA